ncbi:MAG: T9SS type A sorting domain-containing protein [Bacteroidota bacterium]
MKNLLLFALLSLFAGAATAQYCGNSGPAQCTASGVVTEPGLSPTSDSLPPLVNSVNSTTVIEFQNFDTVYFGGNAYKIQSLRIDSIDNLPAGLCWASDRVDNTYGNSESGCIKVNGVPCDSTGQYKIRIIASATVPPGFTIQVDASSVGLHYYVRLINNGDTASHPIDSVFVPFVPYGDECTNVPPTVDLGADQNVCSGSTVNLPAAITGSQVPLSLLWQAIGNTLSCDTCASPQVTLTQNSTFVLTVTDSAGNSVSDSVHYTVNGVPSVSISPIGPVEICAGASAVLQSTSSIPGTYLWQLNGNSLGTATNSAYTAIVGGTYRVVLTTANNCVDTSNAVVVSVIVCTGMDDVEEESSVLVYPNPATDKLTIESDLFIGTKTVLSLFDIAGKEQIVSFKIQNDAITINTASLPKGVYTIKLKVDNKEISRKFVKAD